MRVRVGAALGGFEVEGGYNGPGQPANNWCWWEIEGRAPRSAATGFWPRWEADVARAAAAGCDTVRVSVEWARCEPLDGHLDPAAIAGYCRLLDCCHEQGLLPVVVLHRFAHPAWMGVDFWLRSDSPERFRRWAETAVDHFAGRTRRWVTVDQLNACALWAYLAGRNPPGRKLDVPATIRSLDHLLAGHVLAYEAIKERQPQSVVSTGNRSLPVYELDRLLVDVLLARSQGVAGHELAPWLAGRRDRFYAATGTARTAVAWVLRQWAGSSIPLDAAFPRAAAAVYGSACDRSIDVLHVGGDDDDLRHVLPLPVPVVCQDVTSGLPGACRMNQDLGLPLAVLSDAPTGADGFERNRAAVRSAAEAGAPVVGFYQRLAGAPPPADAPAGRHRREHRRSEPALRR